MAEKKVNEAVLHMVKTLQETNEKIAESAVAAQERNMKYAQNTLMNGVEVLKSQADNAISLVQSVVEQSKKQTGDIRPAIDSAIVAQEQYLKFAQSTIVNGIEVLKSHTESTQDLIQKMEQQARKQQEAFQELARESAGMYMDYFRSPLAFYQQALSAVETATRQSMETFQSATETFQKTTRQGLDTLQSYARQPQNTTQKATK
jgi:hypothetical protein